MVAGRAESKSKAVRHRVIATGVGLVAAVLVVGVAVACAPTPGSDLPESGLQVPRELLPEHVLGCGSLSWYVARTPADGSAAAGPDFLVAWLDDGEMVIGYINADPAARVHYEGSEGGTLAIRVPTTHGVVHAPHGPERGAVPAVWQRPDTGE